MIVILLLFSVTDSSSSNVSSSCYCGGDYVDGCGDKGDNNQESPPAAQGNIQFC